MVKRYILCSNDMDADAERWSYSTPKLLQDGAKVPVIVDKTLPDGTIRLMFE